MANYRDAILVMESRGIAPSVRSAAFTGVWSKLYQAGNLYLDVTLKPGAKTASLQGQLLSEGDLSVSGKVNLFRDSNILSSVPLGHEVGFGLTIDEPGDYRLELDLGTETIGVGGIEVR